MSHLSAPKALETGARPSLGVETSPPTSKPPVARRGFNALQSSPTARATVEEGASAMSLWDAARPRASRGWRDRRAGRHAGRRAHT